MAINLAAPKGDRESVAIANELLKKLSGKVKRRSPKIN